MTNMIFVKNTKLPMWVVAMALCAAAIAPADAQDVTTCASNLAPCLAYLNATTKPPTTCCMVLKLTIATQLQCLCKLYTTPGFAESSGVNVTEALTLPARCGISANISSCETSTGTGAAQPPVWSPTLPGVPGTDKDKNGADKIASSAGFLGLLFWVSIMLY